MGIKYRIKTESCIWWLTNLLMSQFNHLALAPETTTCYFKHQVQNLGVPAKSNWPNTEAGYYHLYDESPLNQLPVSAIYVFRRCLGRIAGWYLFSSAGLSSGLVLNMFRYWWALKAGFLYLDINKVFPVFLAPNLGSDQGSCWSPWEPKWFHDFRESAS